MKVLLTGGSGFIGKELGILLTEKGHTVSCLSRDPELESKTSTFPARFYKWDGENEVPPSESLENIDAVIHLAGENIAKNRWTNEYKQKLINSRVNSTQNLIKGLKKYNISPEVFISASAVGFYGDRADEELSEQSAKGEGFLSDLCQKWEQASDECESLKIRRCILRFGLVISELGGILDETVQLSQQGVLSRLGFLGNQWMSWIVLKDLCNLILFCLENKKSQGVYNAVSGFPIQNKNFVNTINTTLKNITLPPVPKFGLKIALGEKATLLLSSQKVIESRAVKEGFQFQYKNFDDYIKSIFPNWVSGQYLMHTKQWIPKAQTEVFSFFKDENNLERITPKTLGFQIISKSTPQIETNTLINYKIKIHGFPCKWVTKITEFSEPTSFTDIQLKGPYHKWEHTHLFHPHLNGTLIEDKVVFKLPFGIIGRILGFRFVLKDVKNIFKFRSENISALLSQK